MELYAGEAWVSHCMRAGGHPTASLDILFGSAENGKQNCFDLLSDSGFLLLNMKLVSQFILLLRVIFHLEKHMLLTFRHGVHYHILLIVRSIDISCTQTQRILHFIH